MGRKLVEVALAAIALAVIVGLVARGSGFEHRARAAEQFAAQQKPHLVDLQHQRGSLKRALATRQPTLVDAPRAIAVVDSVHPIDSSCAINVAVRDTVIAHATAQLAVYAQLTLAQDSTIQTQQAVSDSLAAALASRHRALLRLPFLRVDSPTLAPFIGLCTNGRACAGVGIAFPIHVGAQ